MRSSLSLSDPEFESEACWMLFWLSCTIEVKIFRVRGFLLKRKGGPTLFEEKKNQNSPAPLPPPQEKNVPFHDTFEALVGLIQLVSWSSTEFPNLRKISSLFQLHLRLPFLDAKFCVSLHSPLLFFSSSSVRVAKHSRATRDSTPPLTVMH